ncbi:MULTISPECIES: hypothetical protein [Rhizobium]|uniref:Uncharacterized protein n=1 Tax=Rhizobium aouanii TaxID=3118145 RepID=A0ABU8CKZ3_9HYPH|nr:hypothetical protein [Rhizobium acaciae]MCW1410792.1 hypothetical protein [Rhizobium acaciae]MCW1742909.1 hypothetical protein [Rhizobium acaciae]MCW1750105.1 hypothetical protein [Rhizobium acaciae]
MRNQELRSSIVREICDSSGLDAELIFRLLDLETKHRDLLAWGARPNLRRDITALFEEEFEKWRIEGK